MATDLQLLAKAGNYIRCTKAIPLAVTAVTDTDITPIDIPPGARNLTYRTLTTTAFTAVTDAQIKIGTTAGGVDLVAATTIKAIGVKAHALVDAGAALHLDPPALIYARITQSGGNTAVGAATLLVEYSMPVS